MLLLALSPIRKQRERDVLVLMALVLLIESAAPAHRTLLSTVDIQVESSLLSSLWKCLHIHTKGCVSTVSISPIKLTIKENPTMLV